MWVRQAMEHHNPQILTFIHGKQLFEGKYRKMFLTHTLWHIS